MSETQPNARRKRTQAPARTRPGGCVQNASNKALGYVRVSTEEQARFGVSLDAQAERIKAYAVSQGLILTGIVHDDGVSGAKKLDTRPGGAEITQALTAGEAEHVIALKLDRLFRDAEDALAQTRRWDKAGISLHVIDMGGSSLNTSSAMGRMFLTMTAAFAELERNLIAERTASSLRHKKQNFKAYSPTPYGFNRSGADLEANQAETAVVTTILHLHASGQSMRTIAAYLNSTSVPTKKGGTWHASTVKNILGNSIHRK